MFDGGPTGMVEAGGPKPSPRQRPAGESNKSRSACNWYAPAQ